MAGPSKKSKLPDLNEITGIAGKLFSDFSKSVNEIVSDYKAKRTTPATTKKHKTPASKPKQEKAETKKEKE